MNTATPICRMINPLAIAGLLAVLMLSSCVPALKVREAQKNTPAAYAAGSTDTSDVATKQWRQFYSDVDLRTLIDSALANNQELNILLQEITIAQNEARARKGEYLPFVKVTGPESCGVRLCAVAEMLTAKPGRDVPDEIDARRSNGMVLPFPKLMVVRFEFTVNGTGCGKGQMLIRVGSLWATV